MGGSSPHARKAPDLETIIRKMTEITKEPDDTGLFSSTGIETRRPRWQMMARIIAGFEVIHECIRLALIGKEISHDDTKV